MMTIDLVHRANTETKISTMIGLPPYGQPVVYALVGGRDVLYVGSTNDLGGRLRSLRYKTWWPDADCVTWVELPGWRLPVRHRWDVERHCINRLHPLYNVIGVEPAPPRGIEEGAAQAPTDLPPEDYLERHTWAVDRWIESLTDSKASS